MYDYQFHNENNPKKTHITINLVAYSVISENNSLVSIDH